jgi:hypothetical protein
MMGSDRLSQVRRNWSMSRIRGNDTKPEKGRVDIQLMCDERIKPIETVEVGQVELAD